MNKTINPTYDRFENGIHPDFRRPFYVSFHEFVKRVDIAFSFQVLKNHIKSDRFIYYNNHRPYSGRQCYGKTPMQTFTESLPLVKQKMLQGLGTAA